MIRTHNEASIRKEYEEFKGDLKRKRKGQFNDINEILCEWFKKCCAANICPDKPMLKEEAMEIEKCSDKVEFKNFTAPNGWLEKRKILYGVRERKVNGEATEVAEYTVGAWMERLVELTRGYELAGIWDMDKTCCFFKALPEKGLPEKKSQARGGKKSKTRLTITFFVNAAGEKAIKPLVVYRSKKPRCFKNIKSLLRPRGIYYYSNPKAWMTTEIITSVLGKINQQMRVAKRKIILFMDNAPCHPESLSECIPTSKSCFCQKTRVPGSNR